MMKRRFGILALLATTQLALCMTTTAFGQWYVNPQTRGTGAGGNGFINGTSYTNGLIPGTGILPGSGILPGTGIVPGNSIIPGTGVPGSGTTSGSGTAQAASGTAATTDTTGDDGGGAGGGGGGYSFTSDPISAYTGAVYSGMANVIRSEGQYNRQTAKALINYEQARTLYLDNQERLFNTRRSIFRARLAARAEDVEYIHAADARAESFIASHRPLPLAQAKLNPSTGQIQWPAALTAAEFDEPRKALDTLFESRAKTGAGTTEETIQIKQRVHEMKEILHEQVLKMPLESYSDARQFLDRMSVSFY